MFAGRVAKKGRDFKDAALCVQWLEKRKNGGSPTIISIMGGPGEPFLIGLADRNFSVQRIPVFRLQQATGLEPKASPEDRASALQNAWETHPELFYAVRGLDPNIVIARQHARQRLAEQEDRKRATLRIHSALRDFAQVLPAEAAALVKLLDEGLKDLFKKPALRAEIEQEFQRIRSLTHLTSAQKALILSIQLYQSPESVLGPKRDEERHEAAIIRLLEKTSIWNVLREEGANIPRCMGMGPALAGSIISEIGDIRRFPSPGKLRAYAKFHLKDGKFPHPKKGEVDSGNRSLRRVVWFWSIDQVERYDHVWRNLYHWRLAHELRVHPVVVPREVKRKGGGTSIVYDFTLAHLHSRTARWVGSKFLEYLWGLWMTLEEGRDLEAWYSASRWPAYFAHVEQELPAARAYLEVEVPKRRREQPKKEKGEEGEFDEDEEAP
ncbi:MAG: transposase [Parcubacteria group bacterium]|nr:transposase [Parcubacteria group bacterium]